MEQVDYSDNDIAVGDRMWWKHSEDGQPRGYLPNILTGRVRAFGFEEPDYSYAVVATDPDGRLTQPRLDRLAKGIYSDQEEPIIAPAIDRASDVDLEIWGELFDGDPEEE